MRRIDGYIPREIKEICNEVVRVRGVITHSDQLGAQQKAMLEDQMDVILSKISECYSKSESCGLDLGSVIKEEEFRGKVAGQLGRIIKEHAWVDTNGHSTVHEENFENLYIGLTDYIAPLLRKAGWFVDEDDGLLTCACTHHKENEVLLLKRGPDEVNANLQLELMNQRLIARLNADKMRIAIDALRLMEKNEKLTLEAISEIALKALDDIAAIGNPEVSS